MFDRLLESLFKFMLLLILVPAIVAMLVQCVFAMAKLFLPWLILATLVILGVCGVTFASRVKQLLPVSNTTVSPLAGAHVNFVKRPRGPRGKE